MILHKCDRCGEAMRGPGASAVIEADVANWRGNGTEAPYTAVVRVVVKTDVPALDYDPPDLCAMCLGEVIMFAGAKMHADATAAKLAAEVKAATPEGEG